MYLIRLALRNVWRNWRRSMLSGFSITAAVTVVIFMWSFLQGEVKMVFDVFMKTSSGHIRITSTDYLKREKMMPLEKNIPDYQKILAVLQKYPEVQTATGRIKFGVLLDYQGNNKQSLGLGIDPEKEEKILELSRKIVSGRLLAPGFDEANIGGRMSQELGIKLNDVLTVVTQTAYGSFSAKNLKVVGIFNFGSPVMDRRTFFVPLPQAQDLLDLSRAVTEIFVMIKKPEKARELAPKISRDLEKISPGRYTAKAWQDQGVIYFWMMLAQYMYMALYAIVLLLSGFTILNTMFMAVLERTREIGMMKALGAKNRQIIGLIILEAIVLGALASFLGAVLGTALSYYLSTHGFDLTASVGKMDFPIPYVLYSDFQWKYVFTGFFFGIFFAVLAALPASLRAAKMEPREALHEI